MKIFRLVLNTSLYLSLLGALFFSLPFPGVCLGEELSPVTLQLHWQHQFEYAGYYAAKEKGFYAEEGLQVDIREIDSAVSAVESVVSGKAEYGTWPSGIVLERMMNVPVVLLANDLKSSPLILLASDTIQTPADLRGKKVMAAPGEIDNAEITFMLKAHGIVKSDIEWIPHSFNVDSVVSGEAVAMTAYLTNQPYDFERVGIPYTILNPHDYGINFYGNNLFTSEQETNENPDRVQSFVRASRKGWVYALSHKEEIVDLILDKYSIAKSREALQFEAVKIAGLMVTEECPIGSIDPSRIDHIARMFVAMGEVSVTHKLDNFIFEDEDNICRENKVLLTDEERSFLLKKSVIRVSSMPDVPLYDFQEKGKAKGMFVDYMNLVAKRTGLDIEYVMGPTWPEFFELNKAGHVDILLGLIATPGIEKNFLLSDSILEGSPVIYRQKGRSDIQGLRDLSGLKVALPSGYYSERLIDIHYPNVVKIKTSNPGESLQMVSGGVADATITDLGLANYFIKKHLITNVEMASTITDERFRVGVHLAVNRDNQLLQQILNKGLKSIRLDDRQMIEGKWFSRAHAEAPKVSLFTERERNYLSKSTGTTMCVDPDWMPFEGINKDGLHVGITSDYMAELAQRLGTHFDLVKTQNWSESLRSVREHDCDILASVIPTEERREYLRFTSPYFVTPTVIVVQDDQPFLRGLQDLSGKKVATVGGYWVEEEIKKNFPDIEIVLFPTLLDAVSAVSMGRAYAVVDSMLSLTSIIQHRHLSNLKIAGSTPFESKLSIGVRDDDELLYGILEKGVATFTAADHQKFLSKWVDLRVRREFDYTHFWQLLGFVSVVAALFFYRHIALRRYHRELQESHEQLVREKNNTDMALRAERQAIEDNVRFAEMIAHEYRTPVSILSINLDVLEIQDQKEGRVASERYAKMRRALGRLVNIIDFALDSERHGIIGVDEKEQEVVIGPLVQEVVESVRDAFPSHNVSIIENEEGCLVLADRSMLFTAFFNVLYNACKYSDEGSDVVIKVARDGNNVLIECIDQGVGFPDGEVADLFQKYRRGANALHVGGAGVGLFMVCKIVSKYRGVLQVVRPQSGGTCMQTRLPELQIHSKK